MVVVPNHVAAYVVVLRVNRQDVNNLDSWRALPVLVTRSSLQRPHTSLRAPNTPVFEEFNNVRYVFNNETNRHHTDSVTTVDMQRPVY